MSNFLSLISALPALIETLKLVLQLLAEIKVIFGVGTTETQTLSKLVLESTFGAQLFTKDELPPVLS